MSVAPRIRDVDWLSITATRKAELSVHPAGICALVTGFPSNIAALQFEWSWQNSHLTRRIPDEQRITVRESTTKVSRSGRVHRRPARPRMSLIDKLRNLHLLLRVPSFARWPLELRFFSADVYESWLNWTKEANATNHNGSRIILDFEQLAESGGGVQSLPINYLPLKDHLQRSLYVLAKSRLLDCSVCQRSMSTSAAPIVVCPAEGCSAVSHIKCLANKFIRDEGQESVIPSIGHCPNCYVSLRWIDLVREASLRMRGSKEIVKLMKVPRKGKTKDTQQPALESALKEAQYADVDDFEEDADDDRLSDIANIIDEPLFDEARTRGGSDEDDTMSVTSAGSERSRYSRSGSTGYIGGQVPRLDMVIENSDWDSAEVLD